ncbi:MAG TPA: tetratricopeptide repeat protein [Candidatus Solibacter sp.]|nr:tetratricopeptide repeat protein [Candidatus Solibacter sp.]
MSRTFLSWKLWLLLVLTLVLPIRASCEEDYSGAKACAKCHEVIHRDWSDSLHNKSMQAATKDSVKGDFTRGKVVLHGATYVLQNREGDYYITESELAGKPWEHRIEYTLGDRRFQHYLVTLPDGRIVVLPPTWDILRKKWDFDLDIGNPEEGQGDPNLVWNKACYSCHVSQGQKNFDLEKLRYQTTWKDFGINCESCHGPGKEHIAKATGLKARDAAARAGLQSTIINPAKLDAASSTAICAQCHSLRDVYASGFKAGESYYDSFTPMMEYRLPTTADSAYWADGRPRQLSNETLGLWESQCFLKGGTTCLTCHSRPHSIDVTRNPQLRTSNNALCAQCHGTIAKNIPGHTHHAAKSTGSLCIECHMPATVVSLKTTMRDHSMSIPSPENTIRHEIPNACNLCHRDKDAEWALRQIKVWYGDKGREKVIRRADTFTAAKQGDAAAVAQLLQILADGSEGPIIRANAAGYLGSFPNDPSAYDALLHSFTDPEPLVRATAAAEIKPAAAQREEVATNLVGLLKDPIRTVRMSAGTAMVAMGVRPFAGEDGERYERAKELYHARAELDSDDPEQQLAAGKFSFLSGDMAGAVAAFRATLKLDPSIPAQYYLARSLAEEGEYAAARQILNALPRDDQQYNTGQRLLAQIEAKEPGRGAIPAEGQNDRTGADAEAQFLNGQVLYQSEAYGAALKAFEQALKEAPQAGWATKAEIFRSICLEKVGRTSEAEAAMRGLASEPEAQQSVDLRLAFVELLYETGRAAEALKHVDGVIGAAPTAPRAYFWRAKVLLQLQRVSEAATAGEEAIRLLPQFPEAHNLLLKIYQMQGRTKEASQQAEWLRDYQRQKESH